MKDNTELLERIKKMMELYPKAPLSRIITAHAQYDDVLYCSNEKLLQSLNNSIMLIESYTGKDLYRELEADLCNLTTGVYDAAHVDEEFDDLFDLTPEKELLAYTRYKHAVDGTHFFQLTEELSLYDFYKRIDNNNDWFRKYDESDKDIKVISHLTSLWNIYVRRYVPYYFVYNDNGVQTFKTTNSLKIPDYYELINNILYRLKKYDDGFVLVLDAEEICRARCYADKALLGISYNPVKKEVEIYDKHHAIEIFHERYLKCTKRIYF